LIDRVADFPEEDFWLSGIFICQISPLREPQCLRKPKLFPDLVEGVWGKKGSKATVTILRAAKEPSVVSGYRLQRIGDEQEGARIAAA